MKHVDEFLKELEGRLSHLPATETMRVTSYYSESLHDKIEDGLTEQEAINSLETIDEIVKNIEEEIPLTAIVKDKMKSKKEASKINTVLLVLVIIFTSLIWLPLLAIAFALAVALFAILWTIPIVIWSLYFSLLPIAISGISFGFVRMFTVSVPTGLAYLGVGILSAGLAVMFFSPIFSATKWWIKLNIYPFKKLKQWLIRKA